MRSAGVGLSPGVENDVEFAGRAPTRLEAQLRCYQPSARRWLAWQREEPALGCLSFDEIRRVLLDRECAPERKDALLVALVGLARADNEAALCVTACLYPGLSRIVWRYRDILDRDDAWAGLAEAMTRRLRAFDIEHTAHFVAFTLLRDAAHWLRHTVRRERAWRDHVQLDQIPSVEVPAAVLDQVRNDPFGGVASLSELDAALIHATRVGGLSLIEAASLLGLPYETAKKRRQRAEAVWLSNIGVSTARRTRRRSSVTRLAA
jgi:DNA-directed RNA polymerase specialized sigma24 family protein